MAFIIFQHVRTYFDFEILHMFFFYFDKLYLFFRFIFYPFFRSIKWYISGFWKSYYIFKDNFILNIDFIKNKLRSHLNDVSFDTRLKSKTANYSPNPNKLCSEI